MTHWKVKFIRRGMEPPYPFGKTVEIVCAETRDAAKEAVRGRVSPFCRPTASKTTEPVTFPHFCYCTEDEK